MIIRKGMFESFNQENNWTIINNLNKDYTKGYNKKSLEENKPLIDKTSEIFDKNGFMKIN